MSTLPYQKIDPLAYNNQYMKMWESNPAFSLGNLLGNLWLNNYRERGKRKSEATAEEMAKDLGYLGDNPVSADLMEAYKKAGLADTNMVDAQAKANTDAINNMDMSSAITPASVAPKATKGPVTTAAVKDIPSAIDSKDGITASSVGQQPQQQQPSLSDLAKAAKIDYVMGPNSKYATTPNPDGDKIADTKLADTVVENVKKLPDLTNFRKDDVEAAIRKRLEADGRSEEQIQYALGKVMPRIEKEKEEFDKREFQGNFEDYLKSIEQGNYLDAQKYYLEMGKLNPELTKLAIAGMPNYGSELSRAEKLKDTKDLIQYRGAVDLEKAEKLARLNNNLAIDRMTREQQARYSVGLQYGMDEKSAKLFAITGKIPSGSSVGNIGTGTDAKLLTAQINAAKAVMALHSDWMKNNYRAKETESPYYQQKNEAVEKLRSIYGGKQIPNLDFSTTGLIAGDWVKEWTDDATKSNGLPSTAQGSALSGTSQSSQQTTKQQPKIVANAKMPNPNNYNEVEEYLNGLEKAAKQTAAKFGGRKEYSQQQLADAARQQFAGRGLDNGYLDQAMRDRGWVFK